MPDDGPFTFATPATVLGFFTRESVYVMTLNPQMRVYESFSSMRSVPRKNWPVELMRINENVWIIDQSDSPFQHRCEVIGVYPRTDADPPEQHGPAIKQSEIAVDIAWRSIMNPDPQPEADVNHRRHWWQFWR